MSDYKIIKYAKIDELENAVNGYLAKGYQLAGALVAVVVRQTNGANTVAYLQTIVKP